MFPRYFPYGQPSSVPNINSLLGLNLGFPLDTAGLAPTQDLSSLLLSAQSNIPAATSLQALSPYFLPQTTQLLPGGLPVTNTVNPLMVQLSLSQMLPFLNPALIQQQTSELPPTSTATPDSHTIVRAPVLYGNNSGNTVPQVSTSKEANKSPPDQIVATYAAAVRAAAIAHQQPLSNAAEVFLSTAASAASSLATSNGTGVTTAKNRLIQRRTSAVFTSTTSPANDTPKVSWPGNTKPPLPWNSSWTRMVDRQADVVVYISPGGSRLKSVSDVRAHLERWLPAEKASAITDDCINSSFCFDATRESRFVSAPDDSIFAFSEKIEASNVNANTAGATKDTTDVSSQLAPPPSPLPSPSAVQKLVSTVSDPPFTLSAVASSSVSAAASTPGVGGKVTNLSTESGGSISFGSSKHSALESQNSGASNGADSSSSERPKTSPEHAENEGDLLPSVAKRSKLEPEVTSQLSQSLPSLTDVAQTTSSFVARSMARAGGPTTVVPSVVPSVLPPSTTTSANNAYALVQHLASIQQQQAFLASAGLIHPVVDTAAQQQQQLLEHFKQQQVVAAAALFLQQQNQHHLQLQQHLQAVYASAIQQQQQQALQQQQQLLHQNQQQGSSNQQSSAGQ